MEHLQDRCWLLSLKLPLLIFLTLMPSSSQGVITYIERIVSIGPIFGNLWKIAEGGLCQQRSLGILNHPKTPRKIHSEQSAIYGHQQEWSIFSGDLAKYISLSCMPSLLCMVYKKNSFAWLKKTIANVSLIHQTLLSIAVSLGTAWHLHAFNDEEVNWLVGTAVALLAMQISI